MLLSPLIAMILAAAPQATAKHISSPDDAYLCNFSKVYRLHPRSLLSVRSSPQPGARRIGWLKQNDAVYVCNEAFDGKNHWYQVYYSDPTGACGPSSTDGLDVRKAKTCKSGWVHQEWINVLSG